MEDRHVNEENNWTCLTTVSNDIEFNIVKGLLETAGIPAVKKVEGLDGIAEIITGVPLMGIGVWVPADRYDEADQLLKANAVDEEELEKEAENAEVAEDVESTEADKD